MKISKQFFAAPLAVALAIVALPPLAAAPAAYARAQQYGALERGYRTGYSDGYQAGWGDQLKGGEERRVDALIKSSFKVFDRYENIVLEVEIVRVEEKELIFKVEDNFYRMHCGDFLGLALEEPLPQAEAEKLGLVAAKE